MRVQKIDLVKSFALTPLNRFKGMNPYKQQPILDSSTKLQRLQTTAEREKKGFLNILQLR